MILKKMPSCTGSKCQVYSGNATRTRGNLSKEDLTRNSQGKIVSRTQSENAKKNFESSVLNGRYLSSKYVARETGKPLQEVMMAKPGTALYTDVHNKTIQWCAKNNVEWITKGIPAFHRRVENGAVIAVANPAWLKVRKSEALNKTKPKGFGSGKSKKSKKSKKSQKARSKKKKSQKAKSNKSQKAKSQKAKSKKAKSKKSKKSKKSSKSSKQTKAKMLRKSDKAKKA